MPSVTKLVRLLGHYRWAISGLIALGVVSSLTEAFSIGLLIPFAERVLGGADFGASQNPIIVWLESIARDLGHSGVEYLLAGTIIALIIVKAGVLFAYTTMSYWVKAQVGHELRCRIYDRLLTVEFAKFSGDSVGEHNNIAAGETWRATEALDAFFKLISKVIAAVVFGAILLFLSWHLTVLSIAVVFAASFVIRFFTTRAKQLGEKAVVANSTLGEHLLSVLQGMRTVRAFVQENRELEGLKKKSEDVRRTFLRLDLMSGLTQPVLEAIYLPFFLIALLVAGSLGTQVPTLLVFLLLLFRLIPHLRELEYERVHLSSLSAGVDAVLATANLESAPVTHSRKFAHLTRDIVFDRVSFSYATAPEGGQAVTSVSFTLRKGQTLAIVGGSGAGKSTLMSLLMGYYQPSGGEIRVDGVSLGAYELGSWRRRIGFAGQDSQLFQGTVYDNISYGRPDASIDEVWSAAVKAGVGDFLQDLDNGIYYWVEQGGEGLSGGQRQRVALARALLINPDIVILDEATNAVDNITEAALQEMLRELHGEKTVIIIAHRMSTIRNADWIVALDRGRVAEQGEPRDLLAKNAAFARLYRLEAEAFMSPAALSSSREETADQ